MQLFCQLLIIGFILLHGAMRAFFDVVNRPAMPKRGVAGLISTAIVIIVMVTVAWGAGAFSILL